MFTMEAPQELRQPSQENTCFYCTEDHNPDNCPLDDAAKSEAIHGKPRKNAVPDRPLDCDCSDCVPR